MKIGGLDSQEILEFLEDNEDLVNTDDWGNLYTKFFHKYFPGSRASDLTAYLNMLGFDPLPYMDKVEALMYYKRDIKSIDIGNKVTIIDLEAFEECRQLEQVNISNSVEVIEDGAFYLCTSLPEIVIPDSVTIIGECAFACCSSLRSVTIGSSVESIGYRAFGECSELTLVNWNAVNCTKVGSSDSHIFRNCWEIKTVNIGYNVKTIPSYVFSGCSVTSVTIGSSVTSIGEHAFDGCIGLTSITFNGTKSQWDAIKKGVSWDYQVPAKVVHCSDGDAELWQTMRFLIF